MAALIIRARRLLGSRCLLGLLALFVLRSRVNLIGLTRGVALRICSLRLAISAVTPTVVAAIFPIRAIAALVRTLVLSWLIPALILAGF